MACFLPREVTARQVLLQCTLTPKGAAMPRHWGNNDVTRQINSRDFSVGETTESCSKYHPRFIY